MTPQIREKLCLITRYAAVGVLNAVMGFGIFLITINFLLLDPVLGFALTVLVWTGFGYELQRILVFKAKPSKVAVLKFFAAQFIVWAAGTAGMFVGLHVLHFTPELSYLANIIVWTTASFLYSRFSVFREPTD